MQGIPRLDAGGTVTRDSTGRQSYGGQQRTHRDERPWICRFHAINELGKDATQSPRAAGTQRHAEQSRFHAFADHQPEDVLRPCAQSHTDTDLADATAYAISQHTVNAY